LIEQQIKTANNLNKPIHSMVYMNKLGVKYDWSGERIVMALTPVQAGMLLLTFVAVMNNLHGGETNAIGGISHFALFAAFIALVMLGMV